MNNEILYYIFKRDEVASKSVFSWDILSEIHIVFLMVMAEFLFNADEAPRRGIKYFAPAYLRLKLAQIFKFLGAEIIHERGLRFLNA